MLSGVPAKVCPPVCSQQFSHYAVCLRRSVDHPVSGRRSAGRRITHPAIACPPPQLAGACWPVLSVITLRPAMRRIEDVKRPEARLLPVAMAPIAALPAAARAIRSWSWLRCSAVI